MLISTFYRLAAVLLLLGALGHTFGGMLAQARGGQSGAPAAADAVFAQMKSVHFTWQGADTTWYNFWMGNGLGVSALLLLAIVVLWTLGGLARGERRAALPIAWTAVVSLILVMACGFLFFSPFVGSVFGAVALLAGIGTVLSTA